jgi:hypothetical protein
MKIIGLTGYGYVGKDSVGDILVRSGWHRIAFADNVRALALEADPLVMRMHRGAQMSQVVTERLSELVGRVGWDAAKKEDEVRRTLQVIGTGVRKVLGESMWIEAALGRWPMEIPAYAALSYRGQTPAGIVVTDIRHENEAAAVRQRGGTIVRVSRPGVGPLNGHETEAGPDRITPDYVLDNDESLRALEDKVTVLLKWLG